MKRSLLVLAASAVGAALISAPAAQASPAGPAVRNQATTASESSRVERFWTPERMRSATPIEKIVKISRGKARQVTRGKSQVVPQSFPNGGGAWTGGGLVTKATGRVFFSYQGRTASCSGNAVTSGNKSTVMTAGHCVKLEGNWHTNWVFVPGYHDGQRPHGTWTAKKTLATAQWAASEDINFDVGAAVVNQLDGKNLTDAVGAHGIAFNQARGQNMYAFGFPAAAPYNGEKLIYCSGKVFNDFLLSRGIGMNCNMTGGSSGGPWFLTFNESTGTGIQNSVNSFKYNFLPNYMFGPYFGPEAQDVYTRATAA